MNLAPAARSSTQVHHPVHPFEDVELVIYLEQLEGTASPPALFLGQPGAVTGAGSVTGEGEREHFWGVEGAPVVNVPLIL